MVKVWNYPYKKSQKTMRWHDGNVSCILILDNGKLCSCGFDNLIKIWD